ncbi:MAG TPA: CTP synthase [Thermoanaerobaculia bacterium]|nr:CTP synthase [Thermoanaerobaculia bacterium]
MEDATTLVIPLIAEYDSTFAPHPATEAALNHSAVALGVSIRPQWMSTEVLDDGLIAEAAAIWIGPGSPYKNLRRTLAAIRIARENGIPCFGTCGGFQHIILEYARNVLGYRDAAHAEYDPYASRLFISSLACSLAGRSMALTFLPESRVASIYGSCSAEEEYYCNFGVNPEYAGVLTSGPLRVTGRDAEGEIRVVEWLDHPFFMGTLFVPQTRSRPGAPHPLVTAFLRAAVARSVTRSLTRV